MSAPTITVRYFAGAAAAAGRDEEPLEIPARPTLATVLTLLRDARPEVAHLLERCSFLWDGVTVRDSEAPLPSAHAQAAADADARSTAVATAETSVHTLDILPPFAGG